mmetsp:Transcript_16899/g.20851  ORF Transcript_16899/g.20851 Transcript_16899/m.20851 type:complete len:288 (+) Transcript_16899:171-1034(+)|eukprot:CAMPEP_0204821888 /NCGR_PEP_ID=MMETSP1346-20131115/78_1 /ASSEMBLY_ACC=CAM_ASM_000771 /TAXON_ID=215587 /ORGANISM="Aplanochytrium stocchinoi, Strain GSBS06" /LENGTH=287 /DNA_ID=CAMNT_0051947847 /DNA_START=191 /DNA_END=1054 /DNA_ORIENTATION=+
MTKLVLGMVQLLVGTDKAANLVAAQKAVAKAVEKGAQLVSLPECFNSPYATDKFREYSETIPDDTSKINHEEHPSTAMLCDLAKKHKIYLIGGSIPERDPSDKIFNTCVIVDPEGKIITKHRKMHLFDIDVPGGITFKESDTLTGGDKVTTFDTPYGKVGVGICYDMRFAELAQLMRNHGCSLLVYPGAFNTTTGPPHWELLQRARALDNQVFVATASPARNPESKYQAWGHSSIVDPWGTVLATTGHDEDIVVSEIDLDRVAEIRRNIPISKQVRTDIYNKVSLKE